MTGGRSGDEDMTGPRSACREGYPSEVGGVGSRKVCVQLDGDNGGTEHEERKRDEAAVPLDDQGLAIRIHVRWETPLAATPMKHTS